MQEEVVQRVVGQDVGAVMELTGDPCERIGVSGQAARPTRGDLFLVEIEQSEEEPSQVAGGVAAVPDGHEAFEIGLVSFSHAHRILADGSSRWRSSEANWPSVTVSSLRVALWRCLLEPVTLHSHSRNGGLLGGCGAQSLRHLTLQGAIPALVLARAKRDG